MEHMSFFNVSPIQFFDSTQYDDIDDSQDEVTDTIETIHESKDKVTDAIESIQDSQDEVANSIEITQDSIIDLIESIKDIDNSEINMECLDDRYEDILIDNLPSPKVKSKTLDICPNIPKIPTGNTDGLIARIPVVLAQLVIPINITSFIDLPEEALEIKDIEKRLKLQECVLLQPTNILFIKGLINKSIEYSTIECSDFEGVCGKLNSYKIDIPFECSTAIDFFTKPLDPISNTKETFQYSDMNLYEFNKISEEFFNEMPFCKLLSSKIVEFDEYINSENSEKTFIQIQEKMVIEIRMEVLQNQPVVIVSASNSSLKLDID